MEDFWKLGASFNRTQAAQPNIATAPSALNQVCIMFVQQQQERAKEGIPTALRNV
jgi:hypothetical protein